MLVPSHVLGVHPVLSGWWWPRQGHSQGSALIQGNTVNFEAFDLADVKIIGYWQFNKLYFMQYYTELNINAENPDLVSNK
jgi:hypothetical protein